MAKILPIRQRLVGSFSNVSEVKRSNTTKRVGYLYDKMADKQLIRYIIVTGAVGKRGRTDVEAVLSDLGTYVDKVYDLVVGNSYIPTPPRHVKIFDKSSGKEREIGIVPYFPDGIMHRLATEVAKPVFMRGMYAHSCASIPKRGNMHAIKYVKKALRNPKKSKYCAKLDIRHFYPSLKHDEIIGMLRRKIKDEKYLELVRKIISSDGEGITIGFYINQWLANVFLEELDHKIIGFDGVSYYVRNMDDMVLIGSNKRKLHSAVDMIRSYLETHDLTLKDNWQVFRVDDRGIDFVGYRFFHGYTLLRKRNFLRLARQARRCKKKVDDGDVIDFHNASGLLSRAGQLKHCSGENILKKYVHPIGIGFLKDIVRMDLGGI